MTGGQVEEGGAEGSNGDMAREAEVKYSFDPHGDPPIQGTNHMAWRSSLIMWKRPTSSAGFLLGRLLKFCTLGLSGHCPSWEPGYQALCWTVGLMLDLLAFP